MPILIGMTGPYKGKAILVKGKLTFGSNESCHIRLGRDTGKVHAFLFRKNNATYIRDLGCMTGTYVSNRRVKEFRLRDGDLLEIGSAAFRFRDKELSELKAEARRAAKPAAPAKPKVPPKPEPEPIDRLESLSHKPVSEVEPATEHVADAATKKPAAAAAQKPKRAVAPPGRPLSVSALKDKGPQVSTGMMLRIATGEKKGKKIALVVPFTIGCDLSCDIRLDDDEVSQFHAIITGKGDKFFVRDLSSDNGTLLNFESIEDTVELLTNDVITIGFTSIDFIPGTKAAVGPAKVVPEKKKAKPRKPPAPEPKLEPAPEAVPKPPRGPSGTLPKPEPKLKPEPEPVPEPVIEEEIIPEQEDAIPDPPRGPSGTLPEAAPVASDVFEAVEIIPIEQLGLEEKGAAVSLDEEDIVHIDLDDPDFSQGDYSPANRPGHAVIVFSSKEENQGFYQDMLGKLLMLREFSEDEHDNLLAAVRETATNGAKHGNKYNPSKKVFVEYEYFPDRVRITITDEGPGFQHESYTTLIRGVNAVDMARKRIFEGKAGGIGLILVEKTVDEFFFNEAGNSITLVKKLPQNGP